MVATVGNATTGQPSHNPAGRPTTQRFRYIDVACPSCGAKVGETCKRAAGERAFRPHAIRRERALRKPKTVRKKPTRPAPKWWGRIAEALPTPAVLIEWDSMDPPTRETIAKAAARTAARQWPEHRTSIREAPDLRDIEDYATGEPCGRIYRVILRPKD